MINFEIKKTITPDGARIGELRTSHGEIQTPAFLADATPTEGTVVSPAEMRFWGAEAVKLSILPLLVRPGESVVRAAGGLHGYIGWPGPIVADFYHSKSGFFGESIESIKQSADGLSVQVRGEAGPRKITPEAFASILQDLGADIFAVLSPTNKARIANPRTRKISVDWTLRAIRQLRKIPPRQPSLIFAPIEASLTPNILAEPGIGGWVLRAGSPGVIPGDPTRPRLATAAKNPEQALRLTASGADLVESHLPYEASRRAEFFVFDTVAQNYHIISLAKGRKEELFREPVSTSCDCYACRTYTRGEITEFFRAGDPTGLRMATMHNLKFFLNLFSLIRRSIEYESFTELARSFRLNKQD